MNKRIGTGFVWLMSLWILLTSPFPALAQSGGLDMAFKPGFDNTVFSILAQPDGKLLVSGFFTKAGGGGGTGRNGIARLNPDANLDTSFNPGTGAFNTNLNQHATVATMALQRDGKTVVGGYFNQFNEVPRNAIARLNTNGSLDTSFNPIVNDLVVALSLQPDGRILIGGEFTTVNGISRNRVARLNTDGSLDTTFDPGIGLNASVQSFALQTNGAVIIGGQFSTVNGATRVRVARLNANGSLDTTFDVGAGPNNNVLSVSLQADGKVIIGGSFTTIGSDARHYVARLNSNGLLDASFQPNIALGNGSGLLAVQTEVDGKVYVAGYFVTVDDMPRKDFARLNDNGSLDTTFAVPSGATGASDLGLYGIALQADGKVLVGGNFTRFNGTAVNYLARLLADQGGSVEFADANYSVDESDGNATIAVRRSGSTNGAVTVNYLTINGTATAGADYVAQAGALLFGPGETNKVFTVPILLDGSLEPTETLTVALGNPIGGIILGTNHTATLTIINNTNAPANSAPVLPTQSDRTIDEMTVLTVTNTASDADVPASTLTYQLLAGPANANISTNGIITWTPTEAQGPGSGVVFTTKVTDDGTPALSATNSFTVTVNELNSAPELPTQTTRTVNEMATLIVTNTASDSDLPANTLIYQLVLAPAGASIDINGVITWTPSEAQGPGAHVITTVVTDNGVPPMSATNSFTVNVQEVNSAPVLSPISDQVAFAGYRLTVTNSATDMDLPTNGLTFTLDSGAPSAAFIDPANGLFVWTPATNQLPGTNTVTVRVTDTGAPSLDDSKTFRIVVVPPPIIESIVASNNSVSIRWSAIDGRSYRVQIKSDLSQTNWNDLAGDVSSTGSTAEKTDTSPSESQRFYRVMLLF